MIDYLPNSVCPSFEELSSSAITRRTVVVQANINEIQKFFIFIVDDIVGFTWIDEILILMRIAIYIFNLSLL